MGNNVSLIAAVTATTISSANYNTNLNALNNAASYAFSVGQISAINTFSGGGFGTYTHGLNPFTPVHASVTRSDNSNGTLFGYGVVGSSVMNISANTGNAFTCLVYAPS